MKRTTVAPLLIGAVAGAVTVAFWLDGSTEGGIVNLGDALRDRLSMLEGGEFQSANHFPRVVDRLDAYRNAQAETDTQTLLRRLDEAARLPDSIGRDLEFDALLARLAELDPEAAFQTVRSLGLDSAYVVDALILWAEQEAGSALAVLASIEPAKLRTEAALALLDVLGDEANGIDRIASALPQSDRDDFLVARLARRAEYDPFGAFREAAGLSDPDLRQRALPEIAAVWVATDPYSALAQADSLDRQQAAEFRRTVYQQWARLDGEGFAQYIELQANLSDELTSGIIYLLAGNPERALRALDGVSGGMAGPMRQEALMALAATDPDAAMSRLAAVPPGQERERMLSVIAQALARRDPQEALNWVRGMEPRSPEALRSVAMAIAQTDFSQALALLEDPAFRGDSSLIMSLASSVVARDPERAASAANQLVQLKNLQGRNALQSLLGNWMQVDSAGALDWVIAHEADVDIDSVANAARNLAQRDPVAAVAMTDRMPERFRAAWVAQVAGSYAAYDLDAARNWIEGYRGSEAYEAAAREILVRTAQVDPRAAAAMLQQSGIETQRAVAATVAGNLAGTEPLAAANWAAELRDPAAQSSATGMAVKVWSAADYGAARNWTLNLRNGPLRDGALTSLAQQSAVSGDLDLDLLSRFSTASEREKAIGAAIPLLARSNPEQAEDILEREITDANLRARLSQQLQQVQQFPSSSSGVFIIR